MNYYGKTTRIVRTSLSILLVVWGSFAMWAQQSADNAVVPQLVRFSGSLTDENGKPPTGIVGVTFSLYRDQQGGAPLWAEIQNVQPDKLGHYSVMLGSASNQGLPADLFTSGEPRWVGVQLQGQAEQARVMLVSVPYAMKAGDAQTVGGLPASAFVRASSEGSSATGNSAALGSTTVVSNSAVSAVSGGVPGVGRNAPAPALTFVETNGGTAGFLPRFTTSNIIGNSNVFQSGGNVGIGTTNPTQNLQVSGLNPVISLQGSNIPSFQVLSNASTAREDYRLEANRGGNGELSVSDCSANCAERLAVNKAGNVGIGTTTPMHPLQMGDGAYEDGKIWHNGSDRNLKENFRTVNGRLLLAHLDKIPMMTWNFKTDDRSVLHLGPMAQDFYSAFGLDGKDDKHISTLDEGGVALAAVQELYRMVLRRDREVRNLEELARNKDEQIAKLTTEVERLERLEQVVRVLSTKMMRIETGKQAEPELVRASK